MISAVEWLPEVCANPGKIRNQGTARAAHGGCRRDVQIVDAVLAFPRKDAIQASMGRASNMTLVPSGLKDPLSYGLP